LRDSAGTASGADLPPAHIVQDPESDEYQERWMTILAHEGNLAILHSSWLENILVNAYLSIHRPMIRAIETYSPVLLSEIWLVKGTDIRLR
jgi:hypothetical protein